VSEPIQLKGRAGYKDFYIKQQETYYNF